MENSSSWTTGKRLGTVRWVIHCVFRHRLSKVIEQHLTFDSCPCGYWWRP